MIAIPSCIQGSERAPTRAASPTSAPPEAMPSSAHLRAFPPSAHAHPADQHSALAPWLSCWRSVNRTHGHMRCSSGSRASRGHNQGFEACLKAASKGNTLARGAYPESVPSPPVHLLYISYPNCSQLLVCWVVIMGNAAMIRTHNLDPLKA